MKNLLWVGVGLLMFASCTVSAGDPATRSPVGLPLAGQTALDFLQTAEVVGKPENFDSVAITDPIRVALSDGARTLRAVFKDEDTLYPDFRYGDGREVERARDSYKHEIAAFELDRLLGLEIVPPCVERELFSRTGSLCLWVEDSMTEADRREQGIEPPDPKKWTAAMLEVFLFQQLIEDLDFSNIRNLIVDEDFRIYKIDSSMAFHPDPELIRELNATRLSRRLLTAIKALDRTQVDSRLGPWLTKTQRKSLWARRSEILKRAEKLVAAKGEDAVLY